MPPVTVVIQKKPPEISARDMSQALKRFEWLTGFMICRYKFIHHIMGMMVKIPQPGMGTMGVRVIEGGRFELHYDPIWTNQLTDYELTYVFYHEVLHLALHHCTRRPLTTDKNEHQLANMAHDLAVNELIPEDDKGCTRPRWTAESIQKLMDQYPKELHSKIFKKIPVPGESIGCHVDELKKQKDFSDIQDKQSAEWYFDYLKQKQKGGKGKGTLPQPGDGEPCFGLDSHDQWGQDELADEKMAAKIREIDQLDSWGDVSQGVRETILAAQVQKINWRNKIRTWAGSFVWKDRIPTRKKPNRRTGYIHPGYKKSYRDKYLVCVDTSGSVGADLAADFIGVINQLVEYLPIDFMQCDCGVTEEPHPFDRRRVSLEFKGRGGTSFDPIMDTAERLHYKGLVVLTDGEAGAPKEPKGCRVLWVLPAGHNPPVEWGDRVHMAKHT